MTHLRHLRGLGLRGLFFVIYLVSCHAGGRPPARPAPAPAPVAATPAPPAPPAPPSAALRVLFIGNSLTYFNDMPQTFARFVAAAYPGTQVEVKMLAPGGESLAGHRKRGAALAELRGSAWSYVVLQDRSVGDSWKLDGVRHYPPPEPFVDDVRFFADAARAAGATPVLYQVWSKAETLAFVDYASVLAATETGTLLAPIGRAWAALNGSAGASLIGPDGMHPSPHGSALVAVILAQTMFGPPAAAAETSLGVPRPDGEQLLAAAAAATATARPPRLIVPPRPDYAAEPAITATETFTARQLVGTWRARVGGPRLSAGTELRIQLERGAPTVTVRLYKPSERLTFEAAEVRLAEGRLTFRLGPASDWNQLTLTLDGQTLRGHSFHARPDGSQHEYRTVVYTRQGEAPYFTTLSRLYDLRDRDERNRGLAPALAAHYARLSTAVGTTAMEAIMEGFPINEWLEILMAWSYAERDPRRAMDYLRAAVALHPSSVDARLQLAQGYEGDNPAAARAEYLAARALDASSPEGPHPEVVEPIDEALRRLGPPAP